MNQSLPQASEPCSVVRYTLGFSLLFLMISSTAASAFADNCGVRDNTQDSSANANRASLLCPLLLGVITWLTVADILDDVSARPDHSIRSVISSDDPVGWFATLRKLDEKFAIRFGWIFEFCVSFYAVQLIVRYEFAVFHCDESRIDQRVFRGRANSWFEEVRKSFDFVPETQILKTKQKSQSAVFSQGFEQTLLSTEELLHYT